MRSSLVLVLVLILVACHAGASTPDKPEASDVAAEAAVASAVASVPSPPKVPWAERRARVVPLPLAALLASDDHTASCAELSSRLTARPAKGASPAERTLALVARLEGSVQSAGFESFFSEETGDDALATDEALKTVDATGARPIYTNALSHFPSATPAKERKARQAQIAAMPQGARAFDVETLAFHDPAVTVEACDRMIVYALAHVKELKLEPKPVADAGADASR
jgi:hypothetical protein